MADSPETAQLATELLQALDPLLMGKDLQICLDAVLNVFVYLVLTNTTHSQASEVFRGCQAIFGHASDVAQAKHELPTATIH